MEMKKKKVHMNEITCAELISGGMNFFFSYLDGRQNWDTLDTRSSGKLKVWSEN
jgi:hypothetical protein